jgi:bleomycin hydrolase
MRKFSLLALFFMIASAFPVFSQEVKAEPEGFKFTDELVLPASSVKNQHRTGTCWSFSGLSFFESEMLRLNKPETDLSEMFVVYHAYSEKAGKYMRMQGNTNFGGGGAFHDVSNVIRQYGIVPEEVFKGLNYGEDKHVHGELDALLKEQMVALVKNPNRKISPVWHETIVSTLNTYLGALPERFEYKGKNYTPQSFAREVVGLNMDDYVEITSFTHHPFYTSFILEVPDNWSWDKVYNVPLAEMEEIIDYSLQNGFTVAWATDVSEKGFLSSNRGVAMVPVKRTEEMTNAEILRWEKLSDREKEDETYRITKPGPELEITQELRQVDFDSQQTTDDHGMHIVGLARDQTGKTFYKVKNSWGDYNLYDGYFYASKAYVNYKTTSIMVHKDAIPAPIRTKLGL